MADRADPPAQGGRSRRKRQTDEDRPLYGAVDLALAIASPHREPQRRPARLRSQPHREQDMARLGVARGAGRPRRRGDPRQIEIEQYRLPVQTGDGDVAVVRQSKRGIICYLEQIYELLNQSDYTGIRGA